MTTKMIYYTYYKKRGCVMKRVVTLGLMISLLVGCRAETEPEKVILEYAFDSIQADLPAEFYPRTLVGEAVVGTGNGSVMWYDGEMHSYDVDGGLISCPVDGGIAVVSNRYTGDTPVTEVRFYTDSGERVVPVSFGSFTTDEIGAVTPEILGMYPTDCGAALITRNEIISVSSDGIRQRESVRQVISVNYCPDGVCVLAYDDVADRHVYLLDVNGGLKEAALSLPSKSMTAFFLMNGDGYYADDSGIYTLAGGEIMRFSQSGWLSDGIREIRMDGENSFTILGTHAGSGKFGVYEMKKSAGKSERILVQAMYDPYAGRNIPEAAAMFNASSAEYFIECTELEESSGTLNTVDRLLLEKDVPDLVVLDEGTPLDAYRNRGVFLDLEPYLNSAAFLSCAREALLTEGKLYTVSAGFSVRTYSGRAEFLPDTWRYEDLFRLHDSLTEGQRMIWSGKYPPDFLNGAASLIDGEAVDTQTLAKLYELLCTTPDGQDISGKPGNVEIYAEGQVLLKGAMVNSVDSYVQMKAYAGWEEPRIVGYPSADGGVHKIEFDNRIAVFAEGDCHDGAAAFADYLIRTYPVTAAGLDYCSIPTAEECWDNWTGLLQQSGVAFAFEPGSGEWWPYSPEDSAEYIVVEPDDALCEEFRAWLNSITPAAPVPDQIYAILTEELSACQGGAVSAEEAAERAAGRIRLYLSENG